MPSSPPKRPFARRPRPPRPSSKRCAPEETTPIESLLDFEEWATLSIRFLAAPEDEQSEGRDRAACRGCHCQHAPASLASHCRVPGQGDCDESGPAGGDERRDADASCRQPGREDEEWNIEQCHDDRVELTQSH